MKAKEKKTKAEIPFDPVLFAATVPSRRPTAKDIADSKEHDEDAIEPQEYDSMDDMVKDLSTSAALPISNVNFKIFRLKFNVSPAQSFFCSERIGDTQLCPTYLLRCQWELGRL